MGKNPSITSFAKNPDQEMVNILNYKNKNCGHTHTRRKKNSVFLNEPYKFDGNLILACSNTLSSKKGFKTAGTTITNRKECTMCTNEDKEKTHTQEQEN